MSPWRTLHDAGCHAFWSAGIVFKEWGAQTIKETRPSSGTPSGNPTHPRQEQWQRARPERYTASAPARARWANEELADRLDRQSHQYRKVGFAIAFRGGQFGHSAPRHARHHLVHDQVVIDACGPTASFDCWCARRRLRAVPIGSIVILSFQPEGGFDVADEERIGPMGSPGCGAASRGRRHLGVQAFAAPWRALLPRPQACLPQTLHRSDDRFAS